MDKDKGWLKEIFEDVNRDMKAWPKWLKDEEAEHQGCRAESQEENNPKAKAANFD